MNTHLPRLAVVSLAVASSLCVLAETPTPVPRLPEPTVRVAPLVEKRIRTERPEAETTSAAGLKITRSPLRKELHDPLATRPLNPAFDLYPDASLVDFGYLLDAPAGKYGFVQSRPDGHFYFESGGRARFWGVTITQEHIDIPKARIDEVVDNLARAGCNMVRFHSLDNRAGLQFGFLRRTIIDEAPPNENDSQHLDAEYLDRLDYWVAKLKERGIYSFLVLRAFRSFLPGDEVAEADKLPRGATPYAFFNERLIELQKQFARDLLFSHVNPYTGLALGKDPAVALIEVFNEDSLFSRPRYWQEMIEPYRSEFQALWIDYLKRSYRTTDALRSAWTNAEGVCALGKEETLEAGNVRLPDMNAEAWDKAQAAPHDDPLRSPARRRDGVRFAVELQRNYFREMTGALTEMGLKAPACGVVAGKSIPDTFSASREFGFTAENAYQEHPSFEPGRDWLPPFYYKNQNYLTSAGPHSPMPFATRYRWSEKPVAIREWATSWPNQFRAASMLEMAAYARFQDLDCILCFAYYTTGDFTRLSAFDLNNDPARWSLFGQAAHTFLGESTVQSSKYLVQIGYSAEDLSSYAEWTDALHNISWVHRLENVLLTPEFQSKADLLIASGRSHATGYKGSHSILFGNSEWIDASHREKPAADTSIWGKSGYPLLPREKDAAEFRFNGIGFDRDETTSPRGVSGFDLADVQKLKLEVIGVDEQGGAAFGAYHEMRKNLLLGRVSPELVLRFAVDLTNHWYDTPMTHAKLDAGQYVSDSGELVRDTSSGMLTVDAPGVQVIQGTMTTGTLYQTPSGALGVVSQSPFAVVSAIALDGKPVVQSRLLNIKMATVAENRKQLLEPAKHPAMGGYQVMAVEGTFPIVTRATPLADRETSIRIAGKEIVAVGMENGTWEMIADLTERTFYLFCDLPNARFKVTVPGESVEKFQLLAYRNEMPPGQPGEVASEFLYPGWAKYIQLRY